MNILKLPVIRFVARYIKTYTIKSALIGVALLVLAGMAAQTALQKVAAEPERERTPRVSLLNVSEYRIENAVIESIGEVESLSQVQIKSQVSERVKEIRAAVGQRVLQGELLVLLDDVSLKTQIDQAQANFDSAKLALQRIRLQQGQQLRGDTLNKSYEDGLAVLAAVYDEADTLLEDLDDIYFGSEVSGGGETNIEYYANANNDSAVINRIRRLYNETKVLYGEGVIQYQAAERGSGDARSEAIASGYELSVKAAETIKSGRDAVRDFQTTVLGNNTIHESQEIIDGHAADLVAYSLAVDGYVNSLLAITNTINNQKDALETYPIDVQSAELAVKRGEATLENLLAQQDRIAIPAPISGVVATIPVRQGELVNPGETVASIVNPGNVQVKTHVSSQDIQFVAQGTRASIEGVFEGSVTSIAPSLDPETKKVETIVAVVDGGKNELVVGEFANVQIFIEDGLRGEDKFFLPLQSVRVTSEAAFVYTVDQENLIERHQVELGRVIGDSIEITRGIEDEMLIVFSARGLESGDYVVINQ